MKKLSAALLALLLIFGAALAAEVSPVMRVANCEKWVSLRESPSVKAKRITHVLLGDTVTGCAEAKDGFIACEWQGQKGYILAKYLEPAPDAPEAAFDFSGLPASRRAFDAQGENVLTVQGEGCTVEVRRAVSGGVEKLMAVCFGGDGKPVWNAVAESPETPGDGPATAAFLHEGAAGTEVVLYAAGAGLQAYAAGDWGDVVWRADKPPVSELGGGLIAVQGGEGVMYLISSSSAAPVCLGRRGELLWQAETGDPGAVRPIRLTADERCVEAVYDGEAPGREGPRLVIRFSREDGAARVRFTRTGD